MRKQEYKTLAGILTLIILIGGINYFITDANTKTACRAGWQEVEDSPQWKCVTQSGERIETCFEVYDSANTPNYWCKRGILEKQEEITTTTTTTSTTTTTIPIIYQPDLSKTRIHCTSKGCK